MPNDLLGTPVARVYEPRMSAQINLVDIGAPQDRQIQANTVDTFTLDLRPLKARLRSNSWREADSLDLTVSFDEAGIDPRYLRSGEVLFWLDDGGDAFERTNDNLRFIGIVRNVAREFSETSKIVTLEVIDYTTLFLEMTNFPQQFIPLFSDTLRQAYHKICLGTGHINFSNNTIKSSLCDPDTNQPIIPLVALGQVNLDQPISSTVDSRIASGPILNRANADSWYTWTYICSQLGLITYIRGSVCIVSAATDYYTSSAPPLMIYGLNVKTLTERRDLGQVSGRNLCVRSYDGVNGTMLESFFPPNNSSLAVNLRKKKIILPSAKKASKAILPEDYELIDLQIPVTDQALLDELTETLWHERVRAEMSGTLVTTEMSCFTTAGAFDLLTLQAGDNITVQLETDALDNIQSLSGDAPKRAALAARGYTDEMATYIVANLSSLSSMPAQFLVHSVDIDFDASGQSDSYTMTIEFLNTLDATGGVTTQIEQAPAITGTGTDPVPDVSAAGDIIFDTQPDTGDIEFDTQPAPEIDFDVPSQ